MELSRHRLILGISFFSMMVATTPVARADSGCQPGISTTLQLGNTILDHEADKAARVLFPVLLSHVEWAPPLSLKRAEYIFEFGFNRRLSGHTCLRSYGGFSISPERVAYETTQSGYYFDQTGKPSSLGPVAVSISTGGTLYTFGADLLYQTSFRDAWTKRDARLQLVGGLGLAASGFNGNVTGTFSTIMDRRDPYLTLSGRYSGFGLHVNLLFGPKVIISRHADVTMLGGYRAGFGLASERSNVPKFENKVDVFPIYGPFGQIAAAYRF